MFHKCESSDVCEQKRRSKTLTNFPDTYYPYLKGKRNWGGVEGGGSLLLLRVPGTEYCIIEKLGLEF